MRRIVGRIQIYRDTLNFLLQPSSMPLKHGLRQFFPHPKQRSRPYRVLEPRQRRLRRKRLSVDRRPVQKHFEYRVVPNSCCIVGIRIPACQPIYPLLNQFCEGVSDFPCLSSINQYRGQLTTQIQLLIRSLEQQRATIRTAAWFIKLDNHGLLKLFREKYRLCYIHLAHWNLFLLQILYAKLIYNSSRIPVELFSCIIRASRGSLNVFTASINEDQIMGGPGVRQLYFLR